MVDLTQMFADELAEVFELTPSKAKEIAQYLLDESFVDYDTLKELNDIGTDNETV